MSEKTSIEPAFQADVLIIGAGITAIGIARHLSAQGLNSILVDPSPPASLTSDNSLRIIHGGIRYLQQLNFKRSLKSIKAQDQLLKDHPDLIKELSCLMPLGKFGLKSYFPMLCAKFLYTYLLKKAGSAIKAPQLIKASEVAKEVREVHNNQASYYFNWYDAQMVDQLKLAEVELRQISKSNSFVQDLVVSVNKKDDSYLTSLARKQFIKSKAVVNAAAMGGTSIEYNNIQTKHQTHWAQAFNLIFRLEQPFSQAFTLRSPIGREYFLVPRKNGDLAIGTFYLPVAEEINDYKINEIVTDLN